MVLRYLTFPTILDIRESEKFKDIIQGDFLDTYHNLSYKVGVASKQGSYV